MNKFVDGVFAFIAMLFDKVPFSSQFKGYRSVIGFLGLGVVSFLKVKGYGDRELLTGLQVGFSGFTALALNAKGRDDEQIIIKAEPPVKVQEVPKSGK